MKSTTRIHIVSHAKNIVAERLAYTIAFLDRHPLKPDGLQIHLVNELATDGISIHYGAEGENSMPAQSCFFCEERISKALFMNAYNSSAGQVYSVEQEQNKNLNLYTGTSFMFDVFETIFFFISRYEEVFAAEKGQAGWLNESKHLLIRNGLQETPVVDNLVLAFYRTFLPNIENVKTTYSLSHDVDILTRFKPAFKFYRSILATLFYRRGTKHLKDSIAYYKSMQSESLPDPYFNFDTLLAADFNVQAKAVYFMVGGNSKYDNKYKITDALVDDIISLAQSNNYNIGLHPSYNTMKDKNRWGSERERLEDKVKQEIRLTRQHWLRWDWDTSPYILEEQKMEQDSSIGYNSHLGFRCGTGFAYKMYDFKNEKAFSWDELPMSFMESSVLHTVKSTKRGISETMKEFIEKNKENTHIEMNFHNSNFDPTLDSGKEVHSFYFNTLNSLLG